MRSKLRAKPKRPNHAIAFSLALSPSHVPPAELAVLHEHVAPQATERVLTAALHALRLDSEDFARAVLHLANIQHAAMGATLTDVTLLYAVLRRLALVSPGDMPRFLPVAEDVLWLCFVSAAGSPLASSVSYAEWTRFATGLGTALGGPDALPSDAALARLRLAWRFAAGLRGHLPWREDSLDFARLLVALRVYDAGLVIQLRAMAALLTHAVRCAAQSDVGGALVVPDVDSDASLLSQFLLMRVPHIGKIEHPPLGLSRTPSMTASDGALTHRSSARTYASLDDAHSDEDGYKSVVRRSRKPGGRSRTPFHIDFSALQLRDKIGAGSYGEVYEGLYLMSPVAVKVFHINLKTPALSCDAQVDGAAQLARMSTVNALMRFATTNSQAKYHDFVREVRLMSLVRHPNLVLYMGACGDAFTPLCIVSELFTGGSLHDYLHGDGGDQCTAAALPPPPPPPHVGTCIALDIARGMHYLHSSEPNILHRDLKARNVLLSGQKDEHGVPHVVICDFGLCQLFSERGESAQVGIGTAAYMSPDAISNQCYEAADDVYSYGVLLHEIFTRRVPMKGMRAMEVMFQVSEKGLRPSNELDGDIPSDVKVLIEECWHKDREQRPAFDVIISRLDVISTNL